MFQTASKQGFSKVGNIRIDEQNYESSAEKPPGTSQNKQEFGFPEPHYGANSAAHKNVQNRMHIGALNIEGTN